MKTTVEIRQQARNWAIQDGSWARRVVMLLLDDIDELENANARLAPKAKAHDEVLQAATRLEFEAENLDDIASKDQAMPRCTRSVARRLREIAARIRGKEPDATLAGEADGGTVDELADSGRGGS